MSCWRGGCCCGGVWVVGTTGADPPPPCEFIAPANAPLSTWGGGVGACPLPLFMFFPYVVEQVAPRILRKPAIPLEATKKGIVVCRRLYRDVTIGNPNIPKALRKPRPHL